MSLDLTDSQKYYQMFFQEISQNINELKTINNLEPPSKEMNHNKPVHFVLQHQVKTDLQVENCCTQFFNAP